MKWETMQLKFKMRIPFLWTFLLCLSFVWCFPINPNLCWTKFWDIPIHGCLQEKVSVLWYLWLHFVKFAKSWFHPQCLLLGRSCFFNNSWQVAFYFYFYTPRIPTHWNLAATAAEFKLSNFQIRKFDQSLFIREAMPIRFHHRWSSTAFILSFPL